LLEGVGLSPFLLCQLPSTARMGELRLPSTLDPPTSFYSSEFPETVKLDVTATAIRMLIITVIEIGIVKQGALCSKKILVVSATVLYQPRPFELSNPGLLTASASYPKSALK
jgi:hypothetical protein